VASLRICWPEKRESHIDLTYRSYLLPSQTPRLATFLEPLFTKAKIAPEIQPLSLKNADEEHRRPCSSPTPSSLLGQPPSEIESVPVTKSTDKADLQDQDLDSELKILYAGHDLGDVIMKEALDDKQDLLMDSKLSHIFFPLDLSKPCLPFSTISA
jgi:hypothetical protein